ncbi:MAG TPA: protein kinase [Kofleriaceae bacterium]|nr:protein kinase [Kofleriaceae bacterium]
MSLDEDWNASGLVGKLTAGRYLIVKELASDQRRTLYEAEHVERGERVLLAVIRTDGTATEQRLRAGEKLRPLEHPGLARVLDVGKLESGELYVATELPNGTPLRDLLTGKPLDQRRALVIVRQVLEALAAAHAVGAVHGDVTPENILIMPGWGDARVKLIDLGIATLTGAMKAGAPGYSAPESALGAIDARADLYAVGAVLFELLTGHPPFFAGGADALRRLHAYAPVQTLRQRAPDVLFAQSLEDIVATALAKSRDDRFQSAADMVKAVDPPLQALEEAALPPQKREPLENMDDSLLLLANDLIGKARSSEQAAPAEPIVPANVGREVPQLSWMTRVNLFVRRVVARARPITSRLVAPIRSLGRRQKRILGAVGGAFLLVLVIAVVTCGARSARRPDLAQRAKSLLDQGKRSEALALIEQEVTAHPGSARSYLVLGDTQLALFHYAQALAAYQKAIGLTPAVVADPALIANLSRIAGSDDTATAIAALDLIASHNGASGTAVIVSHASTNPHASVRHHASLLAERGGSAAKVDHVTSWSLDLDQADTCDERRTAIKRLAKSADPRALPALERAKAQTCVEREAEAAVQRIRGEAHR